MFTEQAGHGPLRIRHPVGILLSGNPDRMLRGRQDGGKHGVVVEQPGLEFTLYAHQTCHAFGDAGLAQILANGFAITMPA